MTDARTVPGARATGAVTQVDVAVVGAGPAGLAAAATCASAGLTVCLIDRATDIGGQYWRQPSESSGGRGTPDSREGRRAVDAKDLRHLHHDLATFEALQDRLGEAVRAGLVDLRLRTQVWTAVVPATADDPASALAAAELHVLGPTGVAGVVRTRRLVIATGAHDIALPFPGWDLPGVMTIGGIQALLKGSDVRIVNFGEPKKPSPIANSI